MLKTSQKNKIVDLALTLCVFILIFEILFYHKPVVDALTNFVNVSGVWGWIIIGVIQYLQVVIIPVPATFITLASMKMYSNNMILLYFVTLGSVVLGVITSYLIGYKWGRKAVKWCAGSDEDYNKWQNVLTSKKTNFFYLITVLLPVFPDDVLCLIAGSIRMNFWWFLICNVVGRAIGLICFMFVFSAIGNNLITIIIFFAGTVLLTIYKIILKRRLKNESDSDRA